MQDAHDGGHQESRRGYQGYDSSAIEDLLTRRWSPVVMRWLLGTRIADAREAAGHSQPSAAKALGFSLSKIRYIESASRPIPTEADLAKLGDLYQPVEADLWRQLWEHSRAEGWWDDRRLNLPREAQRVFGMEWGAHRIWQWLPSVVPVHAQTEAYLRARLTRDDPTQGRRAQNVMIEVGRNRQRVLEDKGAARAELIVDEAALYRQVGGPDVLSGQIDHLRALVTDSPSVTLRVLPFTEGFAAIMRVGFAALAFHPHASSPDVVHAEPVPGDEAHVLRDEDDLDDFERTFNELRNLALDRDDTLLALDRAQRVL